MHMGLAQDHRASLAQPAQHGRVLGRTEMLERRRAGGIGQPGHVDVVLDGDGHAVQRTLRPPGGAGLVTGAGLGQRAVPVHGDESVQVLARVDAVR